MVFSYLAAFQINTSFIYSDSGLFDVQALPACDELFIVVVKDSKNVIQLQLTATLFTAFGKTVHRVACTCVC